MLAHSTPTRTTRVAIAFAFLSLLALLVALPHGKMAPSGETRWDPVAKKAIFVHDESKFVTRGIANITGQLAVILTLASLGLPYLKRPGLARLHARAGIAILVLAGIHTALFLGEGSLRGWAPGILSFLAFAVHGVTGAFKVHLMRAWGSTWWRLAHRGSAWAALALVIEHILLASWHFGLARWFEEARF